MKKILLSFLFCITLVLAGCSSNNYKVALNNISENRKELYVGSNSDLSVSYICGERENPYALDGKCCQCVEFGVLTFFVNQELSSLPTYTLIVDDKTFSGELEQNPFDHSYVVDICKSLSGQNISATISTEDFSSTTTLSKVNFDWEISGEKALEIVCKKMNNEFKTFFENGAFLAECYIKIVNDDSISKKDYYWYVNIIDGKGKSLSAIVDPHSGEMLAKKMLKR